MAYEVWVRLKDYSWLFIEDTDGTLVADDLTVLEGLRLGWSMPGPLWPRQPDPLQASVTINVPDFGAAAFDDAAEGDILCIEVKLDTLSTFPIATFYGDVASYKATPRHGRTGVTLSVVAVDYTVRLREQIQTFVMDDTMITPETDEEVITEMWAWGGITGLGDPGSTITWAAAALALEVAYLKYGEVTDVPALLATILNGTVGSRMILAPLVIDEPDVGSPTGRGVHHGELRYPSVPSISGAYYWLDAMVTDREGLPLVWVIDGGLDGAGIVMSELEWRNDKGATLGHVTTSGWGGDTLNTTASDVPASTGTTSVNIPTVLQDEANAQALSDFYAGLADFEPWQLERLVIPVTRILRAGGDLNAATLRLFPAVIEAEDEADRWVCYSTGLQVTNVDDTRTPDGADIIEGMITGVQCVISGGEMVLEVALRRTHVEVPTPPTSYSKHLTVAAGEVSADLSRFVTRVDLSHITDSAWWAACDAGGVNISVQDSVGTELPFDLTWVNVGANTGELFFRSDLLSGSNNVFDLTVTVGGTAPAPTDPTGRNAVWDDYLFVTIPSADFAAGVNVNSPPTDRTGNASTVVRANGGAGANPTLTANGMTWGSTATGYYKATGLGLSTSWTLSLRRRQNVNDNANDRAMASYSSDSNTDAHAEVLYSRQAVNNGFAIWNSTDGFQGMATVGVAACLNSWHRMAITTDGTTARTIRLNGANKTTDTTVSARPVTGGALFVGQRNTASAVPWRGDIDYLYLRTGGVQSDAWLTAEASSWETPSGFYTIT